MEGLTRREFTGMALSAVGAGLIGPAAVAGDDEPGQQRKRELRMAVKLDMVHGDAPVLEKFRMLKRLGCDGVELSSPNELDADEVLAARDATGLVIHGTVCSIVSPRVRTAGPMPSVRTRRPASTSERRSRGLAAIVTAPATASRRTGQPT